MLHKNALEDKGRFLATRAGPPCPSIQSAEGVWIVQDVERHRCRMHGRWDMYVDGPPARRGKIAAASISRIQWARRLCLSYSSTRGPTGSLPRCDASPRICSGRERCRNYDVTISEATIRRRFRNESIFCGWRACIRWSYWSCNLYCNLPIRGAQGSAATQERHCDELRV